MDRHYINKLVPSPNPQGPEHSTGDPPVINPKPKGGGNKANPKNKHGKRANMCWARHSTKSHAGDPKCYVAQTQAATEPEMTHPNRAMRTSPGRGGISILQTSVYDIPSSKSGMLHCHALSSSVVSASYSSPITCQKHCMLRGSLQTCHHGHGYHGHGGS